MAKKRKNEVKPDKTSKKAFEITKNTKEALFRQCLLSEKTDVKLIYIT